MSFEKNLEEYILLLTSSSFVAAWVGEHVQDFSHGFFSWFSCPAQQLIYGNLWPSCDHLWHGKERGNLKKLVFSPIVNRVNYSAFCYAKIRHFYVVIIYGIIDVF